MSERLYVLAPPRRRLAFSPPEVDPIPQGVLVELIETRERDLWLEAEFPAPMMRGVRIVDFRIRKEVVVLRAQGAEQIGEYRLIPDLGVVSMELDGVTPDGAPISLGISWRQREVR